MGHISFSRPGADILKVKSGLPCKCGFFIAATDPVLGAYTMPDLS